MSLFFSGQKATQDQINKFNAGAFNTGVRRFDSGNTARRFVTSTGRTLDRTGGLFGSNAFIESGDTTNFLTGISRQLELENFLSGTKLSEVTTQNFSNLTKSLEAAFSNFKAPALIDPRTNIKSAPEVEKQTNTGFLDSFKNGFGQIQGAVGPTGLLIGAAILGVLILKR